MTTVAVFLAAGSYLFFVRGRIKPAPVASNTTNTTDITGPALAQWRE